MKTKHPYEYQDADKYVVLNDNDTDLIPIVLKLPKPPPLHLIDGYGLPPEQQRFKRLEIPRKLIDLEAEAVLKTKERMSSNVNNVVTLLKIQKTFWELLQSRHKELKKELDFIRRVWWHRLRGCWFMNYGKPTYITGRHFFYLNFWTMDTNEGEPRPSYRDRDRKEYLFVEYCWTTNETFKHLDKEGNALRNDKGVYEMVEMFDQNKKPLRICLGKMQPKNRRSGNTHKGICNGLEVLSRTMGTDGCGIQSYSNDNAEEHFKVKLSPAYDKLPIWLKPNTSSGRTADTLKFDVGKNEYGEQSLETKYTYATTASEKFYDGKKMIYLLTDEAGKTPLSTCSVLKRHDVNRNTVAQGNGRLVHGFMDYPSTVDEMADGAFDYRYLSNTSNFYQRIKSTGQTFSGLFRLFIPATEGLDGYIDSYGYSVKDKILPYQEKEGFIQTAHDYLQGKRDALLARGDAESMRAYREEKKLFPMRYADCWLGEAGEIGFDLEKIDTQLSVLRRSSEAVRGNLEWISGSYGGSVKFVRDEENGRFTISKMPPENVSNKKIMTTAFNTFTQAYSDAWRPMYPGMFTLGADPFKFGNKQDSKAGVSMGKSSRLSDGGIAVLWNYDESVDKGKKQSDWDSYRFVATYRYRSANTDVYNEDVLKAAIFFGAMVYPETNIPTTYEYFIKNGFGAYLLYDVDKYSGMLKPKPGMDSLERSKQELFNLLRDYIDYRSHKDQHADFLQECKNIKGVEEMRHYDLLAACGIALVGAKSPYVNQLKRLENNDYDLENFL